MFRIVEPWGRGFRQPPPLTRTAYEFYTRFPDETACRDHLFAQRFPTGFVCPRCSNTAFRWLSSTHLRCLRPGCRQKLSLTAGTILHGTRKPLHLWFRAAFYVVQRGTNARTLQRVLRLTYKIAWLWCHKLRHLMSSKTTLDAPFPPFSDSSLARRGITHLAAQRRHFRAHGAFTWSSSRDGSSGTCCSRLSHVDWTLPTHEEDPVRNSLLRSGVHTWTAFERLFHDYEGCVSDKHLAAYFAEAEFRFNRRQMPPFEAASELVGRFADSRPRPYRTIVGPRLELAPILLHSGPPPVIAR